MHKTCLTFYTIFSSCAQISVYIKRKHLASFAPRTAQEISSSMRKLHSPNFPNSPSNKKNICFFFFTPFFVVSRTTLSYIYGFASRVLCTKSPMTIYYYIYAIYKRDNFQIAGLFLRFFRAALTTEWNVNII